MYKEGELPREKEVTNKLLDDIKNAVYEAFISEVVLREINRAPAEKARQLANLINDYSLIVL